MTEQKPPETDNTLDDSGFIFDISKRSYTVVDNWVFDFELTAHEKIVYIALKRFAISPTRVFPSHSKIAKAASLSVSSVFRAIEGLKKKNLIMVRSQKDIGRSNVYLLCSPGQAQEIEEIAQVKKIEGMSDRQRGMSDRQRGMSDRQRGMSDRQRGMSDRHTIITNIITNINTTTTTLLCFSCKKEFNEPRIQPDIFQQDLNHEVCPFCLSRYIISEKELLLPKKTLLQILKTHTPEKVFLAIDLIHFQYSGKKIDNYQRLLLGLLKKDLIMPENYIPYHERRSKEQKRQKIKEARDKEDKEREKLEEEYFREAERRYQELTKAERTRLEQKSKEELPLILRNIEGAVKARVYQLLMEGEDA